MIPRPSFGVREALVRTFVGGLRLWREAAWIPLIAALPEAAQHAWEMHIAMFASRSAFHALAMDPVRWWFGDVKLAGLLLAMLSAALWRGGRGVRQVKWPRLALAIGLQALAALAPMPVQAHVSPVVFQAVNILVSIATLPLLLLTISALFGDTMGLRDAYTHGWRRVPMLIVLLVAVFAVGQGVHYGAHLIAFTRPMPIVAALMAFDALWVGSFACWLGAAIATGYGQTEDLRR